MHIYLYTYIYISIYVYMYICIYIYMYEDDVPEFGFCCYGNVVLRHELGVRCQ